MAGTLDETRDIHFDGDFLPHMPEVSGRTALAQCLGRRLTSQRGRFWYWPNFGTDLRKYLLTKADPGRIASDAEDECMKDERVESVEVSVTSIDFDTKEMILTIAVVDAAGPFTFTMSITEAKATLVELQEAA